jgi:putative ABC transport system permease protein
MNIFEIATKNFLSKKLSNSLCILLMALGVGLIYLLGSINRQIEQKFTNNIKGIDMVLGAKGSPLQLMLSAVYQIDNPTGNISLAEAKAATANPFVKKAIPIAMGDSHRGYRIVGCEPSYWQHFGGKLAQGNWPKNELECVLGARATAALSLKLGDSFESTHGLAAQGEKHAENKFVVVGIMAHTNSVADQLILTPLASIWHVHEHENTSSSLDLLAENPNQHTQATSHTADSPQITAMLVSFRNPMGLMLLPRQINSNTNMQAALPSIEINRLFAMLGVGIDSLNWLAMLIMAVAGISVFIMLYNSLKERRYELALMHSMGAGRAKLFAMLLTEGLWVGVCGFVLGMLLAQVGLYLFGLTAEKNYNYVFENELLNRNTLQLLLLCLGLSTLAAALPAASVYKMNISKTLAEG